MKDKLRLGLEAGALATIAIELGGVVSLFLKAHHTYWEYAAMLLFNREARGWKEWTLSVALQILFSIQLAIGYSYLEGKVPTKYYKLKGIMFGTGIWMIIQAFILGFKLEILMNHSILGTILEILTAIAFGITLGWWVERNK
jgi:hypothetical protein